MCLSCGGVVWRCFRRMLLPDSVCVFCLKKLHQICTRLVMRQGSTDYLITPPDQRALSVAYLEQVHIRPSSFVCSWAERGSSPLHLPWLNNMGALERFRYYHHDFSNHARRNRTTWCCSNSLKCLKLTCYRYVLTTACCYGRFLLNTVALCYMHSFAACHWFCFTSLQIGSVLQILLE